MFQVGGDEEEPRIGQGFGIMKLWFLTLGPQSPPATRPTAIWCVYWWFRIMCRMILSLSVHWWQYYHIRTASSYLVWRWLFQDELDIVILGFSFNTILSSRVRVCLHALQCRYMCNLWATNIIVGKSVHYHQTRQSLLLISLQNK